MSLQQYVRQVRPRTESYIPPVDRIQNFLLSEQSTEELFGKILFAQGRRAGIRTEPKLKAKKYDEPDTEGEDPLKWFK